MSDMNAVKVTVDNWKDAPQPPEPFVSNKTTIHTYLIDPAAVAPRWVQISDYEKNRVRLVIEVIDNAVALTTDVPVASPDTGAVGTVPQGRILPANGVEKVFYGKDAFYLNPLTTATRVTVTKEYC